jgi:predicted transcriptional regulator
MLKAIFSSKARIKLLSTFLLNPDEEYFIRELTRKLDEQINSIRRELDNLKKIGLLKSRTKNRKKYFYTNKDFLIFSELKDIFLKALNNDSDLIKSISKMEEVELLLLNGVFVGEEKAPVDLLIVGEIDKDKLQKLLSDSSKMGKDLKFTSLSRRDFLYRLECKDKFIRDILADEKTIVAINKLKKELEKIRY